MILILLTILKIIGLVLLVLLGLVVLLLCLALFAPVKYRAKGAKHPDALSVSAFVSYLWPLVRVKAEYPSEIILSVKILWFDLLHPKEKKPGKKKRQVKKKKPVKKKKSVKEKKAGYPAESKSSVEAERSAPTSVNNALKADVAPDEVITGFPVGTSDNHGETAGEIPGNNSKAMHPAPDCRKETEPGTEADAGRTAENSHKSELSEHKKQEKKYSSKGKKASHNEKDTENKIVAIAALLWQYKEMYPDVIGRVFHALKSILPRECNIHLIFGTGSPDNTGYIYGAYCALQEYLPGTIVFEPVWMESYLDVEFELSGKIRLIHFATAAVKIIADKRVRRFISEIRRL